MSTKANDPMAISELAMITEACQMKLVSTLHQDASDLFDAVLDRLYQDANIGASVRTIFELKAAELFRCIKCNSIKVTNDYSMFHSPNTQCLHVDYFSRKNVLNIQSMIYQSFICHFDKTERESMNCENCSAATVWNRCRLIIHFPDVFILQLKRNEFLKSGKNRINNTSVTIDAMIDLSFASLTDMNGTAVNYKLVSFIRRTNSLRAPNDPNEGHYIAYIVEEFGVVEIDDRNIELK